MVGLKEKSELRMLPSEQGVYQLLIGLHPNQGRRELEASRSLSSFRMMPSRSVFLM